MIPKLNPTPFNQMSIPIIVESTPTETYAVDVTNGCVRIRCCPRCYEPYNVLHEDFDGTKFGCMNYDCSEYRPEKIALMRSMVK